jgi:hypothetical protein
MSSVSSVSDVFNQLIWLFFRNEMAAVFDDNAGYVACNCT